MEEQYYEGALLNRSEFNQFFIVLHQMNSRFEVSIQRFFILYVNHHTLIVFYINKSPLQSFCLKSQYVEKETLEIKF